MFKPIKELGQNFLSDDGIIQQMVSALNYRGTEDLVEIGPGHGIITHKIAHLVSDKPSTFISVEIDERFCAKLAEMFLDFPNVKIVCEDILDFLPKFTSAKNYKLIGSLPYYITSPILHKTIQTKKLPEICVFLIQKEVADRVCAQAPDSTYLSSFVQTFFTVEKLFEVPRKYFNPIPEVDGAVIRLTKKATVFGAKFKDKYEGFLHRMYAQPRKMLNKVLTAEEGVKLDLDLSLRAQNVNAEAWIKYFSLLNPEISYES